ncbi:MAG: hydantoinase/oxoprolinase family protein, partial [Alphaproteobacteria bacterium]
ARATVTDANLLLGRIGRGGFLGGRLELDVEAADAALRREVAGPMGYGETEEDVARIAHGVLDLATTLMTGAIKEVTVARGRDVRDFALMAFGGGGPIFGTELARQLGVRQVIVPPHPGNFSTVGMLLAGGRVDAVRSLVADISPDGVAMLAAVQKELEQEVRETAARELGGPPERIRWQADMRYRGQRHSLTVDFSGAPTEAGLKSAFEAAYAERFGLTLSRDFAPEAIGLRAVAEGADARFDLATLAPAADLPPPAGPRTMRRLHVKSLGRLDAPVWDRAALPVGYVIEGPAIIEEYSSTTLVGPDDVATVGALGELRIEIG